MISKYAIRECDDYPDPPDDMEDEPVTTITEKIEPPTAAQIEAAWRILEWWAEENDSTIPETRRLTVEVLKQEFARLAAQLLDAKTALKEIVESRKQESYYVACDIAQAALDRIDEKEK